MFSPLYVGLYLFKSYTGEGEDKDEQQARGEEDDQNPGELVQEEATEKSDLVLDKRDDVIDGPRYNLEDDQGERIENLLGNSSAEENDTRIKTNLSSQSFRNQTLDQSNNASDMPIDKNENTNNLKSDSEETNNNTNTSGDLSRDVLEYRNGDEDDDDDDDDDDNDDDTGSVEFVDSQPITEEIRSARIKQNQQLVELVDDLIETNQIQADDTLDDVSITSSNLTKKMCVAETKFLMQDMSFQNESIFYEDIKQNSLHEELKLCNDDVRKQISAHSQVDKHLNINCVPRVNEIELDLSGQSETDIGHATYRGITEYVTERQIADAFNLKPAKTSENNNGSCSEENLVDISVRSDSMTVSCHPETICKDNLTVTATGSQDTIIKISHEAIANASTGTIVSDKPILDGQCSSTKEVSKESAVAIANCTMHALDRDRCAVDEDATSSTSPSYIASPIEQTTRALDLSETSYSNANMADDVEEKCADSHQQMLKRALQNTSCKHVTVDESSLVKSDSLSNSDEFSDLSDTVVADDLSTDGSVSDLPEDAVTSSCATVSLSSMPTTSNLCLSASAINNDEITNEDFEPSVLSPSKVRVTCITEDETILVEEIVLSANQHPEHSDATLSPEAASNRLRSGALSSTERLNFDWNEHCLKMIVTGTPENSLKVAVTGTPKSPTKQMTSPTRHDGTSPSVSLDKLDTTQYGSLLYGSRDLSDSNKGMREDVQTLRLEVENKNEDILRLKNITHGLRNRLTKVEQQNMQMSQSNDSFLSVRSETSSSTSSCYDSVVSLSYEDTLMRSPSLEENLLLKEEILMLKAQVESKSNTIERLNSKTNAMKAQLIEEEHNSKYEKNTTLTVAKRKAIRPVKSVNDVSVEEMPRMITPSSAGSASLVFVNSTTLPINSTLSEQTSKKTKTKKRRRLFSFGKKKDKSK